MTWKRVPEHVQLGGGREMTCDGTFVSAEWRQNHCGSHLYRRRAVLLKPAVANAGQKFCGSGILTSGEGTSIERPRPRDVGSGGEGPCSAHFARKKYHFSLVMKCDTRRRTKRLQAFVSLHRYDTIRYDTIEMCILKNFRRAFS